MFVDIMFALFTLKIGFGSLLYSLHSIKMLVDCINILKFCDRFVSFISYLADTDMTQYCRCVSRYFFGTCDRNPFHSAHGQNKEIMPRALGTFLHQKYVSRPRSWNDGICCMSCNILLVTFIHGCFKPFLSFAEFEAQYHILVLLHLLRHACI